MKRKSKVIWLFIIFFFVFSVRMFFSLSTEYFSDDHSYFVLRQVEHISHTGLPIYDDSLSYGGRTHLFSPLFYYILSGVYILFKSTASLKIFLGLIASSIVFITYFLSRELKNGVLSSLSAAFVGGFLPIFFDSTNNSLSVFSIALPLMFLSIYFIFKTKFDKKYTNYMIISMLLLFMLSPTSIILILGLLFFLLLSRIEKINISKMSYEITIAMTFFYLWFYFLLYKKAILFHGTDIIWQNIPRVYLFDYFSQINVVEAVFLIGIIPFIFGIYGAYTQLINKVKYENLMILGVGMSLFILLWFKLIALKTGLLFLGASLVLLFSSYLDTLFEYIKKTKIEGVRTFIYLIITMLIFVISIFPIISISSNNIETVPNNEEIAAYSFLKNITSNNHTILASENSGNKITYFTGSKNVIDDNFLFVKNIDQRLNDVRRIYITRFSQEALELSKKYLIDYILIDETVKQDYLISDIFYKESENFELIYDGRVKIYEVKYDVKIE